MQANKIEMSIFFCNHNCHRIATIGNIDIFLVNKKGESTSSDALYLFIF